MNYARYFKTDQKVFLINISPDRRSDVYESLTGIVAECGEKHFHLSFPYLSTSDEVFPFREGMYFKVTSETFGVGVQLSARFEGTRADGCCCFTPTGNLELFQRRQIPRFDLSLPMLAVRKKGSPGDLKDEWERSISQAASSAGEAPPFERSFLNLSAGGVRFEVEGEVDVSDLYLIEIDLEDGGAPVSVVAETVWFRTEETRTVCGNRFILILKKDQERLIRLITDCLDRDGKGVSGFSSNEELLDKMIFSDI